LKTRIGFVAGILFIGAMAWGQAPGEKVEELARLRARLEVAELAREADRAILKESILLVKRAERDHPLEQHRSEREAHLQAIQLKALRQYVETERKRFEEQGVELEAMRRELASRSTQPARPVQAAPGPTPKEQDGLAGQTEETELNLELLQAKLNLLSGAMTEQTNAVAALEVRAADPQAKGDEALRKELQAAGHATTRSAGDTSM